MTTHKRVALYIVGTRGHRENCRRAQRNSVLMASARHQRAATPALLKTTFNQFTTDTMPAPLRNILQVMQQFSRPFFLCRIGDPDFRQALVGRQVADTAGQKRALQTGDNTLAVERVGPQGGDG